MLGVDGRGGGGGLGGGGRWRGRSRVKGMGVEGGGGPKLHVIQSDKIMKKKNHTHSKAADLARLFRTTLPLLLLTLPLGNVL